MNTDQTETQKIRLMRVAAWGQALGFLAMTVFVLADPASMSTDQVDLLALLVVFAAAIAISLPRVAEFLAKAFSAPSISLFILAISFATFATSIAGVSLAFSIPEELVTAEWQYTRATSLITLTLFLAAFAANTILSIQLRQASRAQDVIAGHS